jgi:hypothetical protein
LFVARTFQSQLFTTKNDEPRPNKKSNIHNLLDSYLNNLPNSGLPNIFQPSNFREHLPSRSQSGKHIHLFKMNHFTYEKDLDAVLNVLTSSTGLNRNSVHYFAHPGGCFERFVIFDFKLTIGLQGLASRRQSCRFFCTAPSQKALVL